MRTFIETELGQAMINDFIRANKLHEETEMTDDEKAVAEQKSLLYKLWCRIWYGHLEKKGFCLRCGADLRNKA